MVIIGHDVSKCVWEPESALPHDIIAEFNSGIERDLVDDVYSSGGRTLHTISSQPLSPPVKVPGVHRENQDKMR